jgi:CubicO group peptidase (beta-lactamase class C family)
MLTPAADQRVTPVLMDFAQDLDCQLRALAGEGGFRGVVRVESEGAVLLDTAYGRDGASRDLEPGMAFQIASVSKTFAGACMLSLVDRGRVSLDDPVIRWVGALPASWSAMTVRHLLTHTSGLSHWDGIGVDLRTRYERADLIGRIASSPLLFAPGARWSYSSPGYVLVAHIIEAVTGRPYREIATDKLLLPLGLTHTSFGDPPTGVNAARGSESGRGVTSADLRSTNVGTGDVWSTSADLASWPRALASGDVLNETSRTAIFTRQAHITASEDGLTDVGYCYGWYSARCQNMPIVFHTGDQPGFTSLLAWIRDLDTVVAVLAADDVKLSPAVFSAIARLPTRDR